MDSSELLKLYTKKERDEKTVGFIDGVGFSIIRDYPEETKYFEDNMKMFIKVSVEGEKISYSVNMTEPKGEEPEISYSITDGDKYKKRVTNYYSSGEVERDREFEFTADKKVKVLKTGKEISINDFVEVLESNHLSDRMFWKRKLNTLNELILKFVFWLANKKYESRAQLSIDIYHFQQGTKEELVKQKDIEPFFNYFYISKNLLFSVLLISFIGGVISWQNWPFGDFSASNPILILLIFLTLFMLEIISLALQERINKLFEKEETFYKKEKKNFVEKLYKYQMTNKFKLKT